MSLKNKKILLGVTGGIACYKACDLVRKLKKEKADVQVVMTRAAQEFVTALSFQALSGKPVRSQVFNLDEESQMGHIDLADNADIICIAPATAHFIAKAAHGFCDDLLSTLITVTRAPIVLAPAMNVHMWKNPILQENINKLKSHNFKIIGPASGSLACGYEGEGRLEDTNIIVNFLSQL